jgi:hypothetical protein
MSASQASFLTGRRFFPQLISGSFQTGLHEAFYFAAGACVLAAAASWMRGKKVATATAAAPSSEELAAEGVLVSFESLLPVGVGDDQAD